MSDPATFLGQFAPLFKGLTLIGIVAGVAKGFEWADGGLSQESRFTLSKWLKSVPGEEQINAWASVFPNLIDRVFGRRALSWKFLFRSCIASVAAVTITTTLEAVVYGRGAFPTAKNWNVFVNFAYYCALSFPINGVPDYLSLVFSRFIVRQMAKRPTAPRVSFLLLLDAVASAGIALAALLFVAPYLTLFTAYGWKDIYSHNVHEMLTNDLYTAKVYLLALGSAEYGPFLRIYVIASLFTSIWVWLYVLASVAIRILHTVRFMWLKLLPLLSINDKPMQAIGRVAGIVAGFGYLGLLAAVWLLKQM